MAIAWIDHKNAHDSVPLCWIIEVLKTHKVDQKIYKPIQTDNAALENSSNLWI
jgi:hypothetical protein